MSQEMVIDDRVEQFILGGDSEFTIESKSTEKHYTYRVKPAGRDRALYWMYVMVAPQEFQYAASMRPERDPQFSVTKGSAENFSNDSPSVAAFRWFWGHLHAGHYDALSSQAKFYHAGKCGRCRRTLTDPESIERGFGPYCWEEVNR